MADAENKVFELKVGIFIAVGILLFFIMVFSIGDVYLIKKGYTVDIIFNFVNGIGENAPVRLAGVNVGQVEKIKIFFDEKETKTKGSSGRDGPYSGAVFKNKDEATGFMEHVCDLDYVRNILLLPRR